MTEWHDPELNVNRIAERLHIHRTTLSALFKKYQRCSVLEALQRKRFCEVRLMLENNFLSVKEIAETCGFGDANYMSRLFKQRYGCTPGDFRRNIM